MATETMDIAQVAVLIVGYNNADDVAHCLAALAKAAAFPNFDVFICENGGRAAYDRLIRHLVEETACCAAAMGDDFLGEPATAPFLATRRLKLASRPTNVMVGCANDNLGYAGGINSWLRQIEHRNGWTGVWILNPDAEPAPGALAALVNRAEAGGKGMVGSTILEAGSEEIIRFRGGIHWQKLAARDVAIGLGDQIDAPIDLPAIERAMDCPSGASMYVTRRCIEQIGLMDESYFLFYEDLDWGVRAKKHGLGYASDSIVAHQRGTTTGSAGCSTALSRLSVYLQHRNAIHFVRRHYPWSLFIRIAMSTFYAARFLLHRAPTNCAAALEGMVAGIRGETGVPSWYRNPH